EIRAATQQITTALQAEPLPVLNQSTTATVSPSQPALATAARPRRRAWKIGLGAVGALAGCVLIVAMMLPAVNNAREHGRKAAFAVSAQEEKIARSQLLTESIAVRDRRTDDEADASNPAVAVTEGGTMSLADQPQQQGGNQVANNMTTLGL